MPPTIPRASATACRSRSNAWSGGHPRALVVTPHAARPGLRPRLPSRPRVAGTLRPRTPTTISPATSGASTSASSAARASWSRPADAEEFFQLVEKAEGRLYWLDLDRLLIDAVRSARPRRAQDAGPVPRRRARRQARRADPLPPSPPRADRARRVPDGHPRQLSAPLADAARRRRARRWSARSCRWRWRLRNRAHRLSRDARRLPPLEPALPRGHRLLAFSIGAAGSGESRPTT